MRAIVRLGFRPVLSGRVPLGIQRFLPDAVARITALPPGTRVTPTQLAGVPVERVEHSGTSSSRAILYFHGGAYVLGSALSHRALAAHLSRAAGVPVYNVDYRLAPEHPYPAAIDDAFAAYRALLDIVGGAGNIVVAGDSAGGGVSAALALRLRERDIALPAAVGLICPTVDLTMSGPTWATANDVLLTRDWGEWGFEQYRGGDDPRTPELCPLEADLGGLPPIVLHSVAEDPLRSDSERLEERARAAGVPVEHERFSGLWHDFHLHAGTLAESDDAVARMGRTLRAKLDAPANVAGRSGGA
jgi:acetyl esterase/lipase